MLNNQVKETAMPCKTNCHARFCRTKRCEVVCSN